MATIESRLATTLEQVQRKARPELVLIYPDAQNGKPTPEQAAMIEQAEKQRRPVRTITIIRAEDSFPGWSSAAKIIGNTMLPIGGISEI